MGDRTWDEVGIDWDQGGWTWDEDVVTSGHVWDETGIDWDQFGWLWGQGAPTVLIEIDPEIVYVRSLSALSARRASDSQQDVYAATIRVNHNVGSWLQILDADEHPLWEIPTITDGGVSFDIGQTPDRSLDVTVLDVEGRLISDAPSEEAADARRFVRAIYEQETPIGWMRFPLFTGPLSSGGLRRQGAEVTVRVAGKESLYLSPYTTWEAQHYPKHAKVVDVIHDIAAAQGERRFNLPELDERLGHRLVIPRFSEAWTFIQRAAGKAGRVAYFDGDGYLSLRPKHPKTPGYVFDGDVVLTPPELDDDYTTIINAAVTTGPDPDGPTKPLHVPASLEPPNPFGPRAMARNGVPRRAIATDEIGKKSRSALAAHSRSMLHVATKTASFDSLPIPHLRPGTLCRVVGEYEGQQIDERFVLRQGFMPLTANAPMTVGTWKPVSANWRALHVRPD